MIGTATPEIKGDEGASLQYLGEISLGMRTGSSRALGQENTWEI